MSQTRRLKKSAAAAVQPLDTLADAALHNVKLVKLAPTQHALVLVFDEAGSVQVRGTDNVGVTHVVGALSRAAYSIHQLRSLQSFHKPGDPP